jgi:hypothetical protein
MDVTLDEPTRAIDVHMAIDGPDLRCTDCHTTYSHVISGRCFTIPAVEEREFVIRGLEKNLLACESCHGTTPHADRPKLNDHTDRVACQTCHVPFIAPVRPTKMWWDWSRAGERDEQGKPVERWEELAPAVPGGGEPQRVKVYDGKKGEFVWALRALPEYYWFNGEVDHTFIGDVIDDRTPGRERGVRKGRHDRLDLDQAVVSINALRGSAADPAARIVPLKVHRGKQPYDPVKKTFVVPNLFPSSPALKQTAYWKNFEWGPAIEAGMEYLALPYSGEHGWIQTEMFWPLSHMVAPAAEALACADCHAADGRLAALGGFYLPGRDAVGWVDGLGWGLVLVALLGVTLHGGVRAIAGARRRSR